jgi:predicted DNA-binding transcriptional regulator AlpA|tara:strand:- start:634 stop:936 length:303 start_codon:yes stop_codon:yes gene_type:complete
MSEIEKAEVLQEYFERVKDTISQEVYSRCMKVLDEKIQELKSPQPVSDKITFTEVMQLFGKQRNTIYSWIEKGKLPTPVKFGRFWYFNRVEINKLYEGGL